MEFRLSSQLKEKENFMTEEEFCKTLETFFFVTDEKLSRVSYQTSLAHCAWDGYDSVPVNKLAHILFIPKYIHLNFFITNN